MLHVTCPAGLTIAKLTSAVRTPNKLFGSRQENKNNANY